MDVEWLFPSCDFVRGDEGSKKALYYSSDFGYIYRYWHFPVENVQQFSTAKANVGFAFA